MKNKQLNTWFWRWHIISALISFPVVVLLNVTGIIYLYKTDFNNWAYQQERFIETPVSGKRQSYQAQLDAAHLEIAPKIVTKLVLKETTEQEQATTFYIKAKGHAKNALYINPYTLSVQGEYVQKDSFMYLIRKLHGELLLDLPGTLVVELTACWLIVMLLTGLYLWWPQSKWRLLGFFWVRSNTGSRITWRDIHAVFGFYASITILIVLLGGLPWTQVFGSAYKYIQNETNSGYPHGWRTAHGDHQDHSNHKNHSSHDNHNVLKTNEKKLDLDQMVALAKALNLTGDVTIEFKPNSPIFTVSNRSFYLSDQERVHFDSSTGEIKQHFTWNDVGFMMQARQFLMRFHQGEYGLLNWYWVLVISLLFLISNIAGLISYLKRKQKGSWSLPQNKQPLSLGAGISVLLMSLAIFLPLFGLSVVLIYAGFKVRDFSMKRTYSATQ